MNARSTRSTGTAGKVRKSAQGEKAGHKVRQKAEAPADAELHMGDGAVFGVHPGGAAGDLVALLLDGALVATAALEAGGAFRFALPPHTLAHSLEVLDVATGRAVVPAPLDLRGPHWIEWLGWTCRQGVIAGRFRVTAPPGQGVDAPLLVQALLGDRLYMQAFAQPGADGAFTFSAVPHRLLNQAETAIILPIVAGVQLDHPLTLRPADLGFIGHVDATDQPMVQGWAVNLSDRGKRVDVDVRLGGRPIGATTAEMLREDLRNLGLSDGRSGFRIDFPSGFARKAPTEVRVFVAGTEMELIDSPYTVPAVPPMMGYFDAVEGPFAGGWAVNMHDPGSPLAIEAVCEGEVIGAGAAKLFRGDVEASGLPTPWCGFRFTLDKPLGALVGKDISLRVAGTDLVLGGSPRQISRNNNIVRYLMRGSAIPLPTLRRLSLRMTAQTAGICISVIMPIYNTRREWLLEAVNSVIGQWSANWELICVDDGSTEPHVGEILDALSRHDPRIRVIRSTGNLGIAGATNLGLNAATGEYVAFMDHDDFLEPDALHKMALAAKQTGAELIYSDEAITSDEIDSIVEVRARPAFSYDYYLSHPYFVHVICVKTTLARALGGWDEGLKISADVDFVLRAIERADAVAHVPRVLYRWRTHGGSAGHQKMDMVTATMISVLDAHLGRMGLPAKATPGLRYNEYRIEWPDDGGEVLIIIPTRNRVDLLKVAIDSIEKTSKGANYRIVVIDHESTDKKTLAYLNKISARHTIMPYSGIFNYAKMNNAAARLHGGEAKHLLFLNNDVEAIEDGWIQRLRSLSGRKEVGAVGPLLLYSDDRVQHGGVLVGFSGAADHAMKFQQAFLDNDKSRRHPGYNCNLTTVRDYSAVTAACVMIRHEVFKQVKGFDESFVVGFNDTDLCLRIVDAGYKVLYDGFTVLYHHESATRTERKSVDHPDDDKRLRKRWPRFFTDGDPFYSPLLAPKGTDHTLRQDDGCKGLAQARLVRLRAPPAAAAPRRSRGKRKPATADAH